MFRHFYALLTALALLLLLFPTAAFAQNVYVTSLRDNTVSVIDATSNPPTVTATISVGKIPRFIAVSPDGARVYVGNAGDQTISVIDTTGPLTNSQSTIPSGGDIAGMVITPDGTRLFILHSDDTLLVVDAHTYKSIKTFRLSNTSVNDAPPCENIIISPDGSTIYTSLNEVDTGLVWAINANTYASSGPSAMGGGDLAITPDGTKLYGYDILNDWVEIASSKYYFEYIGHLPTNESTPLAFVPNSTKAYIFAPQTSDAIELINATTGTAMGPPIRIGANNQRKIVISSDGSKICVPNYPDNTVSIINTTVNPPVTATVSVGTAPEGVAFGPQNAVSVDSAVMVDSHTLQVKLTANFSDSPSSSKSVEISTDINGKHLDKTIDSSLSDDYSDRMGTQHPTISIDLAKDNVPRFTSNQKFSIAATLTENSNQQSATKVGVVLLPVVLVPGIDPLQSNANGGFGSFPGMENYLTSQSKLKITSNDFLGDGYLLGDDPNSNNPYPTLFTLAYSRNTASFAEGATSLSNLYDYIHLRTYADSINIVGHSKGGLVSRKFIISQPNTGHVKSFIMCMTPNLGSLWARLDGVTLRAYDYRNLYPLWPWLRRATRLGKTPYIATPNSELALLNTIPLPSSLDITDIWSGSINTEYTDTLSTDILGGTSNAYGLIAGDFIVPAFSQQGFQYNPNYPLGGLQTLIPAFQQAHIQYIMVSGSHASGLPFTFPVTGGLDIPDVQSNILRIVMASISP